MDLTKCNGRRFRCMIEGHPVTGRIKVQGHFVILVEDETRCEGITFHSEWDATKGLDRIGAIGFRLLDMTAEEIKTYKDWQVGDKITNGRDTFEVIFRSGEVVILKNEGGCAEGPFTCDEIYDDGYRLIAEPAPEEAPIEMTMDEIASKLGVPVERLHIKKE